MVRKQKISLDEQVLRKELTAVSSIIQDVAADLFNEFRILRGELKAFRREQKQFNREITTKVDINTTAIQSLDKRVRYQEDMPERLRAC